MNATVPEGIDRELWLVVPHCCPDHHFFGENPHTFHGRISVWCPRLGRWTRISKSEISEMSAASRYWLAGYLSGNEPDAPRDGNGDYLADDAPEMVTWRRSVARFAQTGYWNAKARTCASCRQPVEPAQPDETCLACAALIPDGSSP
jgi:hypothetical protein